MTKLLKIYRISEMQGKDMDIGIINFHCLTKKLLLWFFLYPLFQISRINMPTA